MLEITGNIFDRQSWSCQPFTQEVALCITTNGNVRANGMAVMGAGVAKACRDRFPQTPVILGQKLALIGNQVHYLLTHDKTHLLSFPTKHDWRHPSDMNLIVASARTLAELASFRPDCTFVLTRPGCGCGGLSWLSVKNTISFLPDNCWIIEL
ncbi:MAG: hypothetical protein KME09_20590 [Pleurocapsa minor HA4230-MV1]|jgi:hypothetical protein|nr:hypothetical protein [Pleurocapsa minor HA4230-MV1]